jgi:hypothetical protein
MLRRAGWLGLLVVVTLWVAPAPSLAEEHAVAAPPSGLGRLWSPPPQQPDPSGEVARLQLRRNLVNVTKLALALTGAGLLAWGLWLRRSGRPEGHRTGRDALLAALGFAGFWGWWNFLYLHYPDALHTNNFYVYYVGAKYFPELGYSRLYECTAVADLRSGLRGRVLRRRITDLHSYELVDTREIVAHPERCTAHFSPARWAAFQHDVAWFRSRIPAVEWEDMQRDHGYNAPPSWGLLGTLLAGSAPASTPQVVALVLLDPLLDLAMWSCVWWAFGWRALCVALLYWGTNHTAEYSWTGGSFLRDDWLAATLIGLCLLRRDRPTGAGFLLGYAALLRIFPALALLGVGLAALLAMAREGRVVLRPEHRRLAGGAALAVALVVPLSSLVAGGASSWRDFADNTRLHVGTPANNLVGLQMLISYDHDARLSQLLTRAQDPSAAWKQARRSAFAERRWAYWAGVAAYLLLLGRALRRREDWEAAILGLGAMLVLIEPTCYYTSILLAFGLLWTRREGIGVALLALSAAQWGVAAAFDAWDEIFTWQSVPLVAFVFYATATMGARGGDEAPR